MTPISRTRAPYSPAPVSRKPLYLDGVRPIEVALDGKALRVAVGDDAARLLPLSRISRAIVSGAVTVSVDALLACADEGITITFLGSTGEVRALWLGPVTDRNSPSQLLADLLDRPDGLSLYHEWRRAMERRSILIVLKALDLDLREGRDPAQLRSRIRNRAYEFADRFTVRRLALVHRGLLDARIHALLNEFGLIDYINPALPDRPNLARDFARILDWRLEPLRLGWLVRRQKWQLRRKCPLKPVCDSQMVRLFESRAARLDSDCHELITRLRCWLAEVR